MQNEPTRIGRWVVKVCSSSGLSVLSSRKWGWGGEQRIKKKGEGFCKMSEHPAAGRVAVQHSVLNKQASSGGQLEPPPASSSLLFGDFLFFFLFFPPTVLLLLLPPQTGWHTRDEKGAETVGAYFPGRSARGERGEKGERAESCSSSTVTHFHTFISLFPKRKLIIQSLLVIGYSGYRFFKNEQHRLPAHPLSHTFPLSLQLQRETRPRMNASIDLTATPKSNGGGRIHTRPSPRPASPSQKSPTVSWKVI